MNFEELHKKEKPEQEPTMFQAVSRFLRYLRNAAVGHVEQNLHVIN